MAAIKQPTMSSDQVLAAIVRHIESKAMTDQYTYIPECTCPNGRRIDLMVMANWASHGYNRTAYEIKVSRADFLKEIKDGSKTETMLKYADQAFFVVPKGLVTLEEVPAGCGLIEVTAQGCSYVRKAPKSEIRHEDSMILLSNLMVQAVRRHGIIKVILATGGAKELTVEDLNKAEAKGYKQGMEAERKELRNLGTSNMIRLGVNANTLCDIGGWTMAEMVRIYAGLDDEAQADAFSRLYSAYGPEGEKK